LDQGVKNNSIGYEKKIKDKLIDIFDKTNRKDIKKEKNNNK
jgi:hypothetical protein